MGRSKRETRLEGSALSTGLSGTLGVKTGVNQASSDCVWMVLAKRIHHLVHALLILLLHILSC